MREELGTFFSFDRLKLFYRYYPSPEDDYTMVIVHGHGEHSGRYEKFSRFFSGVGISIASFDLRGTGRSEGERVYVRFFEEFLEDLSSFVRFLQERFGAQKKIFLLGHSLGALIAIHWARRFPEKIQALILSSPCLGLRLPKLLCAFNSFLHDKIPHFCYQNPVYPPHLTHDQKEVENYRKDSMIQRKITVRLLHEMLRYMTRLEAAEIFRFPFPVYVLMAELEKIVDPQKTHKFFDKVVAPRKNLEIFHGFYHEVFNELGQEKVFEKLKEVLQLEKKEGRDGG